MTFLTPKGPITAGVYGLQRLVAESVAFQRRVEAVDQESAEKYVYRWTLRGGPVALKAKRPGAIIWCVDPAWDMEATVKRSTHLALILTDKDRNPSDRSLSGDNFAEWVDQVLQQIVSRESIDDRLIVQRIATFDPRDESPIRHSRDWDNKAEDSYWDAWFRVETGI
ncbi:MAG: hypothetical protein ACYSWU_19405 [Planctomycetota bacterium]